MKYDVEGTGDLLTPYDTTVECCGNPNIFTGDPIYLLEIIYLIYHKKYYKEIILD